MKNQNPNQGPIGPGEILYYFAVIVFVVIMSAIFSDIGWNNVWQKVTNTTRPIQPGFEMLISIHPSAARLWQ